MQPTPYIIIFGAAVNPDGKPSGALKRRIDSALKMAKLLANPKFIVTGGIGKNKPLSEAQVMKELLMDSHISNEKIMI